MSLAWLQPIAWWGLAALAVPIIVHLLVRQRSRRILFPTLRFLRGSRLAAMRRHAVHDWPLLIVRLLIVALAVAALAGPVLVSPARWRAWDARVARALVMAPGVSPSQSAALASAVEEAQGDASSSLVLRPGVSIADGLRDAAIWFQTRGPSSSGRAGPVSPARHEVVILGDLREGMLQASDLELVPRRAGVRFVPLPDDTEAHRVDIPLVAADGQMLMATATPLADRTAVEYGPETAGDPPLQVRAAATDQGAAERALAAVLRRGMAADTSRARRVMVLFAGAADGGVGSSADSPPRGWMRDALEQLTDLDGAAQGDTLVLHAGMRPTDVAAVHVLERVARAAFAEDRRALEPRRLPAPVLASWSRPAAPLDADSVGVPDTGDRRWLWGAVLVLMLVEQVVRARARGGRAADQSDPAAGDRQVRVA